MECNLPSSVMKSMSYHGTTLTIQWNKSIRQYQNVPKEIAYQLAYSKRPLKTFNQLIKNKYKVTIL